MDEEAVPNEFVDSEVLQSQGLSLDQIEQIDAADSVSQAGSNVSKTSSVIRMLTAKKKAAAEARKKTMEAKHQLEREEEEIRRRREQMELDTEIAVAEAEEKAISSIDNDSVQSGSSGIVRISNNRDTSANQDNQYVTMAEGKGFDVYQQQQLRLIDMLEAPKLEIPVFSGDPLQYYVFIRAFETSVDQKLCDDTSKLLRLIQYCKGEALALVQNCAILEPHIGYSTARERLRERFGDPVIIAQAWCAHVINQNHIKPNDGPALRKYSDLLCTCLHTLRSMNALTEISAQSTLLHIMNILPAYLAPRWRREVVRIKQAYGKLPSFKDLVDFVKIAAEEANVPIYGSLHVRERSDKPFDQRHVPARKQASFLIGGSPQKPAVAKICTLCSEQHMIWECKSFKEMSVDERVAFVKKERLCFNCLKKGSHMSRECKLPRRCNVDNCGRRHSYLLHGYSGNHGNPDHSSESPANADSQINQLSNQFADTSCFTGSCKKTVALPIVEVKVFSPSLKQYVNTFALLDNASSHSFMSEKFMDELKLETKQEVISLTTLEKEDSVTKSRIAKNILITDMGGTNRVTLGTVYSRKRLPINPDNFATHEDVMGFSHLQGLEIPKVAQNEVMILIGQDCPDALMPLNIVKGKPNEPWASQSLLGWSLNGPLNQGKVSSKVNCNFISADDRLNQQVEQFWKIEANGIYDEKSQMSVEDKKAMSLWDSTTSYENGRYVMRIPFKEERPNLPDNKKMAEMRLKSLGRKLSKDEVLKEKYVCGMNEILEKGFAEKVDQSQLDGPVGKTFYIPHHHVISPHKEKIRIVWDCAAKYGKVSLNTETLQGPDFINKLLGVLIRFRLRPVCLMADIKSMYNMISIHKEDQDVLRFLWWENGDMTAQPKVYRMVRNLFGGIFSGAISNYALHKTIQDNEQVVSEDVKNIAFKCFYVDDLLVSLDSVSEAKSVAQELKNLLQLGGFHLTKFVSNDRNVVSEIPNEELAKGLQISLNEDVIERALGVHWNVHEDSFGYKASVEPKPHTKRGALSTLSSVYDPLGLIAPFILKARLIVQELFRRKVEWDDPMPGDQRNEWIKWLNDLQHLSTLSIKRCIKPDDFGTIVNTELHHFCDASELAYGVCSYIRLQNEKGDVHVSLLMARSRLAPLKQITLPRLELAAATLGVRQHKILEEEMDIKIDNVHFWSDSMITLKYISNEQKRFHTYVANRVAIIRDGSNLSQWHFVESAQNAADLCSRGLDAGQLGDQMWLSGPQFLLQPSGDWPQIKDTGLDPADPEVKKEASKIQASAHVVQTAASNPIDRLMTAFSDWHKLKTAVAWMIVLKQILKHKGKGVKYLEAHHIKQAEHAILQYIQSKAYGENVLNPAKLTKSSQLIKLRPELIDGLLSVGGRLKQSPNLPMRSKHPVILPGDSPIVKMIVRSIHQEQGHIGRESILAIVRRRFWIVGARACIRKVLNECIVCKKREPVACQQQMADLPPDRLSTGRAFRNIGIDMYGPIYVKLGRARAKRWGLLITCMATRAVHVEITHSLNTDSFIQGLQRFIARRGKPDSIRCDQGRNFIGAERELREELRTMNGKGFQDYLNRQGIEWKFNPPHASMAGGVWERMIRSIRRVMSGISTQGVLTDEMLLTLTTMAEAIVNNRPITPNSADIDDLEALTPNHFLILEPVGEIPGRFDQECLRKHWRQLQYLTNVLWKRWLREYLPQLQQRTKWVSEKRNLQVGDLVLIIDYSVPKNSWKMGRVLAVHCGTDNRVRSAQVKMSNGVISRPISKICLLEASHVKPEILPVSEE